MTLFDTLNERLAKVKSLQQKRQKWQDQLADCEVEFQEKRQATAEWKSQIEEQKKVIEKLGKISFIHLLAVLTGSKDERIQQKENEIAATTLKYDESQHALTHLEKSMIDIQEELNALPDIDRDYQDILKKKEQLIAEVESPMTSKYNQLNEDIANLELFFTETSEAIDAGESVNRSLIEAIGILKKAKRWGGLDMIGGRGYATHKKYKHLDNAKVHIQTAQTNMRIFHRELQDIHKKADLSNEISGFLTFSDFFFDGLFIDYIVQGEIEKIVEQTKKQKSEVDKIILQLNFRHDLKKKELHRLEQEKNRLLENVGV